MKGTRLTDCARIIEVLQKFDPLTKLSDFWDAIPTGEHIHKIVNPEHLNGDNRFLDVCGKQLHASARIETCLPSLEKFYNQYGHRAQMAASSEGVDWKAVSHAFREHFNSSKSWRQETFNILYVRQTLLEI